MVKYEITVMESERGWGQNYWPEQFDTLEEAKNRVYEINSKNISDTAPDYYMQAFDDIREIRVENGITHVKYA